MKPIAVGLLINVVEWELLREAEDEVVVLPPDQGFVVKPRS